jgi:hypothetical protein
MVMTYAGGLSKFAPHVVIAYDFGVRMQTTAKNVLKFVSEFYQLAPIQRNAYSKQGKAQGNQWVNFA